MIKVADGRRIIIDQIENGPGEILWRFTIVRADGRAIDSSLASHRWMVWSMAKMSWRRRLVTP